ncbi:MAG: histidinol-phosphatase HisJ family protein [Clostridia bacterium]|nr:histidinol-phosphatase HisJ family protein [Clostridia bacterium]
MFDLHIHSKNSHDSKQTLDEICENAIARGLSGVAVCDHADTWFFDKDRTYDMIANCMNDIDAVREKYGERLEILKGVEMAEYLDYPERAERLLQAHDFDVILGSVHSILYEDITDAYSRIDFSAMPMEKIFEFLGEYFGKMAEMVEKTDFDILTHLTCPLRYINGKYKRNVDILYFKKEIGEVLSLIQQKGIALELNTSGIGNAYGDYMPHETILRMYKDMGGKLITLGSDAHMPQYIGNGFKDAKELLRGIGFHEYCVFRQRKMSLYQF